MIKFFHSAAFLSLKFVLRIVNKIFRRNCEKKNIQIANRAPRMCHLGVFIS